jgi:diguanylate cyclase (GGDEF)-like protein/PAS domain S-box-containing protein
MVGTVVDITARKRSEAFERFRSGVLEMLAKNQALPAVLDTISRGVEALHPGVRCSILLLDTDGQRVITPDIQAAPSWTPYKALAEQANLAACWSQPICSATGQILGTFGIYHAHVHTPGNAEIDAIKQCAHLVSIAIERKQADDRLHLAASVFDQAREGILITDQNALILDVNESFSRITGYSRDEVLGRNTRFLKSDRQDPSIYVALWQELLEKGHWQGELWNRRKNGEHYAEMKTISAVRDAQGNVSQYVALFSDITTLHEHKWQLEFNAHHDALTGLPNRVLLADRLHQAMVHARRRQQRLTVVYMDLDGFKSVNDQHGHETGDQLLMALANRIRHTLREGDTLARIGGDEFVAVLQDLSDMSPSLPILQRMLTAAAQPVILGSLAVQVSASLGVTTYPQTEDVDADQLLRQADQAMYQAKLAGKNQFHAFDADQDRSVRGHHESLEHIRQALEKNEFVLFYQPKVNMRTGQVVGAEALIRWQHPEQGLLPPATFLPVIEDHALATDIGEWVINAALTQMDDWRMAGLHVPVSVNLCARQLKQSDFVERLRTLLGAHPDTQAADLELEVLETSALGDLARISQIINTCRGMGVYFALDDFGTGYSSLTYLKRLPVATLKIDQSFVHGMLDDPDDLSILEGVLGLSTAFNRKVIAEGVETVDHGVMLLYLGCELAQGYGIARPMPAEALPGWIRSWQPDLSWHQLPSFRREDVPLLVSGIKHRAWISAISEFLHGERQSPPPMNKYDCCFGRWLSAEIQTSSDDNPLRSRVSDLHTEVHDLAATLYDLHEQGRGRDALDRLGELHTLRDALLAQLHLLALSKQVGTSLRETR